MKNAIFLLTVLLSYSLSSPPPSVTKRYRSDYEYNERTDAFYKLHIDTRRGWRTKVICQVEGAELMVPETQLDIAQLHGMFKRFPDMGEYVWVASDGKEHESAEEPAIINLAMEDDEHEYGLSGCDVVTRKGEIETAPCFRELPFICKVNAKDAPYDPHCDLFADGYQYNATLGSCYKIPGRTASWDEAYSECRNEGAHLVVLNSQAEGEYVQNLAKASPKLRGAKTSWFFIVGFRANKPVGNETLVFKTIFNQTLEEAGFANWSPNEPNNALGNEYCGTMFKNDGKLNDDVCSHEYAFICEKEIQTHT